MRRRAAAMHSTPRRARQWHDERSDDATERAMTTKHVCDGIHYLKRVPPSPVNPQAYPMILFLHVRRSSGPILVGIV